MKLNEETTERMAKEIADGLPICYACDLMGITTRTFENWMRIGKEQEEAEEDGAYARFFRAIKKSYAVFVKRAHETIRMGEKGWQGTAWWLERTNPFFMPKQQIQADDDGKVTVVIGGKEKKPKPMTRKEAQDMAGRLARGGSDADDQG